MPTSNTPVPTQRYRLCLDLHVHVENVDTLTRACRKAWLAETGEVIPSEADPIWQGLVSLAEQALAQGVPGARVELQEAGQEDLEPDLSTENPDNAFRRALRDAMVEREIPIDKRGSKAELSRQSGVSETIIGYVFSRPNYIPDLRQRERLAEGLRIAAERLNGPAGEVLATRSVRGR
jgi:hypothetical protein